MQRARAPAHCGAKACFPLASARDTVLYCVLACLARSRATCVSLLKWGLRVRSRATVVNGESKVTSLEAIMSGASASIIAMLVIVLTRMP